MFLHFNKVAYSIYNDPLDYEKRRKANSGVFEQMPMQLDNDLVA